LQIELKEDKFGAGWVIYRKGLSGYITVFGSYHLGERMEVFDAAYEGFNNVWTMLDNSEHIFLCIDNVRLYI
jgi:hypothetical protein